MTCSPNLSISLSGSLWQERQLKYRLLPSASQEVQLGRCYHPHYVGSMCVTAVPLLIIPVYWGRKCCNPVSDFDTSSICCKISCAKAIGDVQWYLCRCRRTHTATPRLPGVARHWHCQRHTACHESFELFFAAYCFVLFIRSRLPSTANEDFAFANVSFV